MICVSLRIQAGLSYLGHWTPGEIFLHRLNAWAYWSQLTSAQGEPAQVQASSKLISITVIHFNNASLNMSQTLILSHLVNGPWRACWQVYAVFQVSIKPGTLCAENEGILELFWRPDVLTSIPCGKGQVATSLGQTKQCIYNWNIILLFVKFFTQKCHNLSLKNSNPKISHFTKSTHPKISDGDPRI